MRHGPLNLLKLCVGADKVDDLLDWQKRLSAERRARGLDPRPVHVTRMWPRRAEELLAGGSLYWVFKGVVLARQKIDELTPAEGTDGIQRCAIVLDPEVVRTVAAPRRPFQGWRYLDARDAPADLVGGGTDGDLPPRLLQALSEVGVK